VKPFLPRPSSKGILIQERYFRVHEANISILYVLAIIGNVIAVVFWISLAFVAVGLVAVNESLTHELSGTSGGAIFHYNLLGQSFIITRQLVFVSLTLGAIAALTFATGTLQDPDKRTVFFDTALIDLERALGAVAYYYGTVLTLFLTLNDSGCFAKLGQTASDLLSKAAKFIRSSLEFDEEGAVPAPRGPQHGVRVSSRRPCLNGGRRRVPHTRR
jgi:hypothetical protein